MLRRGEVYGQYEVEGLLGEGGMAAVYRVRHVQLGSLHALKVLFVTRPALVERLMREGRMQAQIRHPNVVGVTDLVAVQGRPGLVLEFVEGPRLREWMSHNTPTVSEALSVFRGIVQGVGAAHRRSLVHRDLKPENVLLAPVVDGVVPKVTDFGLVKPLTDSGNTTRTGTTMGTPSYMAPEQIRDAARVDARADMFALGCILYELLTGVVAFDGPDTVGVYNRILYGRYLPLEHLMPDAPAMVIQCIEGLLQKDPDARIPCCEALLAQLYGASEPTPSFDPTHMRSLLPELGQLPEQSEPGAPPRRVPAQTGRTTGWVEPGWGEPGWGEPGWGESAPEASRRVGPGPLLLTLAVVLGAACALYILSGGVGQGASSPPWLPHHPAGGLAPRLSASGMPPEATADTSTSADECSLPDPEEGEMPLRSAIEVAGDAVAVWLHGDRQRLEPGEVPPGTYRIYADFGGGAPVRVGSVEVLAGERVVLRCSRFLSSCRPQRVER